MNTRHLLVLIVVLGSATVSGCGDKLGEVSGTVTLGGQPLGAGVVTVFPEKGTPVAATVNGGAYIVSGVPYGPCRVTVTPLQAEPEVTVGPGGPRKPGQEDPAAKAKAAPAPKKPAGPAIPEKFKSVDTSGLATKVDQEKVTFPISLD